MPTLYCVQRQNESVVGGSGTKKHVASVNQSCPAVQWVGWRITVPRHNPFLDLVSEPHFVGTLPASKIRDREAVVLTLLTEPGQDGNQSERGATDPTPRHRLLDQRLTQGQAVRRAARRGLLSRGIILPQRATTSPAPATRPSGAAPHLAWRRHRGRVHHGVIAESGKNLVFDIVSSRLMKSFGVCIAQPPREEAVVRWGSPGSGFPFVESLEFI